MTKPFDISDKDLLLLQSLQSDYLMEVNREGVLSKENYKRQVDTAQAYDKFRKKLNLSRNLAEMLCWYATIHWDHLKERNYTPL